MDPRSAVVMKWVVLSTVLGLLLYAGIKCSSVFGENGSAENFPGNRQTIVGESTAQP